MINYGWKYGWTVSTVLCRHLLGKPYRVSSGVAAALFYAEDWDDEDDGEWEAPTVPNPEYKGEWKPKM
jgi:hypothetical protein